MNLKLNLLGKVLIINLVCMSSIANLYASIGTGCDSAYVIGQHHYGPFDYMNAVHRKNKLKIVEIHHFTRSVEMLQKGKSGLIGADLDYTLKSFPNHHRALYSMMKYQLTSPEGSRAAIDSMECYFKRAVEINSRDAFVYHLHGIYLHKKIKYKAALEKYLHALKLSSNNGELFYNIGLLYFSMKDYDNSLKYAKKAYENKYPLSGLKLKLQKIGKWK